jgi:hypothetical protein
MSPRPCSTPLSRPSAYRGGEPAWDISRSPAFTESTTDLDLKALSHRLASTGNPDKQRVFGYVVTSIHLRNGRLEQEGSGPNFKGGLVTLCTCKQSMRSEQPLRGFWIAGMSSWTKEFGKQQALVYLMRVGRAYPSQYALIDKLQRSDGQSVVDAKNSTIHLLGDLMMPVRRHLAEADQLSVEAYLPPILGHTHRRTDQDKNWHHDIHYVNGKTNRPASMLVGDPDFTFTWTRRLIRHRCPGALRPYRKWTLAWLLENIEVFP